MSIQRTWLLPLLPLLLAGAAHAQANFPSKPITLIVPVNAGGVTDQIGRAFAASMGKALGQSVVVENKGGANGVLGAQAVAKAAPDGYTLCFCFSGPVSLAKATMSSLPYDIDKAFTPVTRVYDLIPLLTVPSNSPYASLADLLKAAKADPGMSVGHTGVGGVLHLGIEMLKDAARVDMTPVAYPGENPMVPDLVTGRLNAGLLSPLFAREQAAAGKVRLLASMAAPSPLPGVAPVAELGYPGFRAATWSGFFAPAGTPSAAIQKLYAAIQTAAAEPEVQQRLVAAGLTPVVGQTPDQFRVFVDDEKRKWAEVVKTIGGIKN